MDWEAGRRKEGKQIGQREREVALTGLDGLDGERERALHCCQKAVCSGHTVPPLWISGPGHVEDVSVLGSEVMERTGVGVKPLVDVAALSRPHLLTLLHSTQCVSFTFFSWNEVRSKETLKQVPSRITEDSTAGGRSFINTPYGK